MFQFFVLQMLAKVTRVLVVADYTALHLYQASEQQKDRKNYLKYSRVQKSTLYDRSGQDLRREEETVGQSASAHGRIRDLKAAQDSNGKTTKAGNNKRSESDNGKRDKMKTVIGTKAEKGTGKSKIGSGANEVKKGSSEKKSETKSKSKGIKSKGGQGGQPSDEAAKTAIAINYMLKLVKGTKKDKFAPSAKVRYDVLGNVHVRLDRFYENIPVRGGDVVVHMNMKGRIFGQSCTFLEPIHLEINPKLYNDAKVGEKELIIFAHRCCPILAWDNISHGVAPDGTFLVVHVIKTTENTVVSQFPETKTMRQTGWPEGLLVYEVPGRPQSNPFRQDAEEDKQENHRTLTQQISNDYTLYAGEVHDLRVDYSVLSGYILRDPQANGIQVWDFNDAPRASGSKETSSTTTIVRKNLPFGVLPVLPLSSNGEIRKRVDKTSRNTIAVDAQWGLEKVYDFYKKHHFIESIVDTLNGNKVSKAYVHVGAFDSAQKKVTWANACFSPNTRSLFFGDGDYSTTTPQVSLDTIAHEYTHGIFETIVHPGSGVELRALNEANADVIQGVICFENKQTDCWTLAEREYFARNPKFCRSAIKPSSANSESPSFDCYCQDRIDEEIKNINGEGPYLLSG